MNELIIRLNGFYSKTRCFQRSNIASVVLCFLVIAYSLYLLYPSGHRKIVMPAETV